jgi:hypothetical protein
MKLSFEATPEDFIDVYVRSSPLTKEFYLMVGLSLIGNAFVGAIVAQFFFGNPYITALFVLGGGIYVIAMNYNILQRRARNLVRDKLRITKPVRVEVEISEDGLSFKAFGTTTKYDWNVVRVEEETDDTIYFRVRFGELVAVRKRAFSSETEKTKFLDLVNQYWSEATQAKVEFE